MRSAVLSVSRHTTSSRQSPYRSAVSVGVDFVPLFEDTPFAVSKRVVAPLANLSMRLLSSSSRDSSASHQTRKLVEPGAVPKRTLVGAANSPPVLEAHISAPGLLGSMSSATQRPV